MFRSQLAWNIREPLRKSFFLYYTNRICGTDLKEYRVHTARCYSIPLKDELSHKQARSASYKFNDDQVIERTRSNVRNRFNSPYKEANHVNRLYDQTLENNNDNDESEVFKNTANLFPRPVHTIKNIYMIVDHECNIKDSLILREKPMRRGRENLWCCTYHVTWPEKMSFAGTGRDKATASKEAALKCLTWLQNNNKIKNDKPIIYDSSEVKELLSMPLELHIEPKEKEHIRTVVDVYNNEIKDIIEKIDTSNVGETLTLSNRYDERKTNTRKMNKSPSSYEGKSALPIMEYREEIVRSIEENQIILIKGDTGCGKTTQVPQFIIDSFIAENRLHECNVLVSQPRRISAISLATRIAEERNESLGDVVGYHVRLDAITPNSNGSIVFCTTGILLKHLQFNPNLQGISHVIIDEAHERTIEIDMLMTLAKKVLERNPSLKLIIMSATINSNLFQRYFECPVIEIPGRLYPVEMHFMEDIKQLSNRLNKFNNEMDLYPDVDHEYVAELIQWISKHKPQGGILCFLPGWQDITKVQYILENKYNDRSHIILPVHSKLYNNIQCKIFHPAPADKRKIILSTDIAETGITISDVSYVVDTAIKKNVRWNERKGSNVIANQWISKANLLQRKGRAGRVKPGESYHLISKEEYQKLYLYPLPDVLCTSLDQAVLISKTYTSEMAQDFFSSMPQPPKAGAVIQSVANLIQLDILDFDQNLTALGRRIVHFTLPLKLSKALVYSSVFECVDPITTIATIYSENEMFSNVLSEKSLIQEKKQSYHKHSDHIAMLSIYNEWEQREDKCDKAMFCESLNIQPKKFELVKKIRTTHLDNLASSGMIDNSFGPDLKSQYADCAELIRAVLFAATQQVLQHKEVGFKNGYFTKKTDKLRAEDGTITMLTRDSVNCKQKSWPTPFLTYLRRTHSAERRSVIINESSMISPLSILLFSQDCIHYSKDFEEEREVSFSIGDQRNRCFRCDKDTLQLLLDLRKILWKVVRCIIHHEGTVSPDNVQNFDRIVDYKNVLLDVLYGVLNEASKDIDS